jgi:hypothetical protein
MPRPIRATKKSPCPLCGSAGWPCYRTANEEVAFCKSVYSDATDKEGLFRHFLVERDRTEWRPREVRREPAPKPQTPVASDDHLHLVYESVLNRLSLSHERRSRLLSRGLDARAIERGMYRDTPTREESDEIARLLAPLGLEGAAGFYHRGGRWRFVGCHAGVFVPYRDTQGRIRGLSYRLDVPLRDERGKVTAKYLWVSSDPERTFEDGAQKFPRGTKLVPPLHFAAAQKLNSAREVCLTEGALKADVASHLLDVPIIGAAGVSQWGDSFARHFKRRFPKARAVVCYDSDWRTNPHVRHALEKLMADLRDSGVRYVVRSWPEYPACKGIDDLALALSLEGKGVMAA